ncbi:MAG: serine/threonine protein kinase, partial [Myxococcales bacterium]|nr:serine/threonine protein kinase [Myxococcales bacterium]
MTLSALPQPHDTVAGRYVLLRVRGEGMMGVVYEADDRASGQRVALKVLRPEMATVDEVRERLSREGQVIARMRNAHVVRVLDMGTTAERLPFFTMELLEGADLAALLDRGKTFSIAEAVRIAREACAGLAEAHALNVIHRDIKPHNMFLAQNPDGGSRVVLLDFGVSKLIGSETELTITQASIGTPLYMAPEQVRSARNVDERSDVWAVAVVLFELCTGVPPFDGESAHAVTAAIVADPARRLRELLVDAPPELERVIATALEKDPKLRYPSALAFSDALAPFDTGATAAPLNEQATLVMSMPLDVLEGGAPPSSRERTELAAPMPAPVVHATVMEPPASHPHSASYGLPTAPLTAPPASHAIARPAAPSSSKLMPALLAATVLLALAGIGLLVMLGLEQRKQPASSASAAAAAARPGTVNEALAAARDGQGLAPFEPCVWRASDRSFVATPPREALPEAMQDLDGRFGSSPPPSFVLERAAGQGGDITLAAVTPLSPALREPPTPRLV